MKKIQKITIGIISFTVLNQYFNKSIIIDEKNQKNDNLILNSMINEFSTKKKINELNHNFKKIKDNIDLDPFLARILETRNYDWVLIDSKENGRCYQSPNEPGFCVFKTVFNLDLEYEKLVKFLKEPKNIRKYQKNIKNLDVELIDENTHKFFIEYNIPFPFQNREIFVESNHLENKDKTCSVIYLKRLERKFKNTELKLNFGGYLIKKIDDKKSTLVCLNSLNPENGILESILNKTYSKNNLMFDKILAENC